MTFTHVRIDESPPCDRLGFCCTPDLTGNGLPDILVGGMGTAGIIDLFGKRIKLSALPVADRILNHLESNLFWYENPGWERHDVASHPDLSVGACTVDIDGDGMTELIAGENNGTGLYWFDPPTDPRRPWTSHLITDAFRKYHDVTLGDIDGDGDEELVILSQGSEVVCYYELPDSPRRSPWPDSLRHTIADDLLVEGVAIRDLDNDGEMEIVAGPNVFKRNGGRRWNRREIEGDWKWTRIVIADLDGDGVDEIVLSEGDLPYQGDRDGRVGIVDTIDWSVDILADGLHCPHSLDIGDVTGSGSPDVLVGEMGLDADRIPRLLLYENDGSGEFDRTVLDRGIATHEATLVDLTGDGKLDIASKSYTPNPHVDVWIQDG